MNVALFTAVGVAVLAVLLVLLVRFVRKRQQRLRDRFAALAREHGFADVTPRSWSGIGIRALWQGYRVSILFQARYKQIPARVTVTVAVDAPLGRLIVSRRFGSGFLERPMTWFGPPLLELQEEAARAFWIRATEPSAAERLFRDRELVARLDANLVERFDRLTVSVKELRIVRAIDERRLRDRLGEHRWDEQAALVAAEAWPLVAAVVHTLSLRPRP